MTAGAILVMMLFVGEFGQTAGWRIRRCRAFNTVRVGVDTTSSGAAAGGVGTLLSGINRWSPSSRCAHWHGHDEDADLHLDGAVHQHPDRGVLPGADRRAGPCCPWTATWAPSSSNDFGGNSMMYVNLIWIWGHLEVYMILPLFGVF
jgi:cytochrome o ubiquinol oxidase subunit 1